MKYVFAVLIGALIALMVNLNGTLGIYTNNYFSSFMVHAIASVGTFLLILKYKEDNRAEIQLPFYYYCGGLLGGLIIVLNNISFQNLGVSATLGLALAGQVTTSFIVDSFGLMNMTVIPFNKRKIPGILLMILGVTMMILL